MVRLHVFTVALSTLLGVSQACQPLMCAIKIIQKIEGGQQAAASCTAVTQGDIAQIGPCISDSLSEVSSGIPECDGCGSCTPQKFSTSRNELCGGANNVVTKPGDTRCASYADGRNNPEANDILFGNYVYHCNNTSFDIAENCNFPCSGCGPCVNCQGDPDGVNSFPTRGTPDPKVYGRTTTQIIYSKNEDDGASKRRSAKFGARQANNGDPEPEDSQTRDSGRFRTNDYANICKGQDRVYTWNNLNTNTWFIRDYRMVVPAPNAITNSDIWVCDHIVELNFVDDFINSNPGQYSFLRNQVAPVTGSTISCPIWRLQRIFNSQYNLVGLDKRVNWLKHWLLVSDPNSQTYDFRPGVWEDYVVIGTYQYLSDTQVAAAYGYIVEKLANALDDLNSHQDPGLYNAFINFAERRILSARMKAYNEYIRRSQANQPDGATRANVAQIRPSAEIDDDDGSDDSYHPRGQQDVNPADYTEPEDADPR